MARIGFVPNSVNIIRQIDNSELYKKILDLQGEILGVVEENSKIKKEIEVLKEKASISNKLTFEPDCYWLKESCDFRVGPRKAN